MEQEIIGLSREFIIHPGETLSEVIEDREMTQKELAIRTGVTEKHISTIIHGKKGISSSFAMKLEYALGIESNFWMNLQTNYERELLEFENLNNISEEEMKIPQRLKEVIKMWIQFEWLKEESTPMLVLDLRKIFCMSNLLDIPKMRYFASYRAQGKTLNMDPYILFAWQRMCELLTESMEISNGVDVEKLKSKISEIKKTMFLPFKTMKEKLTEIFASCGIKFKVVPNFKGAPVQGFIKKTENGSLILCITLRQKFKDIFWFTLFHEIAHILHGDTKNYFLDFDSVSDECERKADELAADLLINPKAYRNFVEEKCYKNPQKIEEFAILQEIEDYIVEGRLMKEGLIPWNTRPKYD